MALGAKKKVCTTVDKIRAGCPRVLVPCYEQRPVPERPRLIVQRTLMRLSHTSKAGLVKKQLDLGGVHDELRVSSAAITLPGGAANIVLAKMSAEVQITLHDGSTVRDFVVFDLKIPGAVSGISYDYLRDLYKGRGNLYPVIKYFYKKGRALANPGGHKHGTEPGYDPRTTKHDQQILHSEQMLVAYLAHPDASEMLVERLRAEIRGHYPAAQAAKVYNMSLHMHSTKTCCAPCEYALLGLMNTPRGVNLRGSDEVGVKTTLLVFSFMHHFTAQCARPSEMLSLSVPRSSPFQLFVTVTADSHDVSHQVVVDILSKSEDPKAEAYDIHLKRDPASSRQIFTTQFSVPFYYDLARRLGVAQTNLLDKTVAMSGSTQTKGSPVTASRVDLARCGEGDVSSLMARLG
jgi:hypothetical protein